MKISSINLNGLNFGKTIIDKSKIRSTGYGTQNVSFVEYDPKNYDDKRRMQCIGLYWGEHSRQMQEYVRRLSSNFDKAENNPESMQNKHFYGLEDEVGNTIAISQTTERKKGLFGGKSYTEIDYIQTIPDEQYTSKRRRYKGVGETLVAQIVKNSMHKGSELVKLTSINEHFWKESGFFVCTADSAGEYPIRQINKDDFQGYIDHVEKKTAPKQNIVDIWG